MYRIGILESLLDFIYAYKQHYCTYCVTYSTVLTYIFNTVDLSYFWPTVVSQKYSKLDTVENKHAFHSNGYAHASTV